MDTPNKTILINVLNDINLYNILYLSIPSSKNSIDSSLAERKYSLQNNEVTAENEDK